MLGERDRGRGLDPSKQTLNEFLDDWLEFLGRARGSWELRIIRSRARSPG